MKRALALLTLAPLLGCHDFQTAYDGCVSRGICSVDDVGPGALDPAVSMVTIDRGSGVTADGEDVAMITVTLRDAAGHALPNLEVQLSATGASGVLTQPAKTDGAGTAIGKLASTTAELKTITATAVLTTGNVPLTARPTVRFVAGPAAALAFVTEPSDGVAAVVLSPAVQVAVVDAHQNIVPTASNTLSVMLAAGPMGGALMGNVPVSAVNGIATFGGLFVTLPGSGYSLVAVASGLNPAASRAFASAPASASATVSAVTVAPSTLQADGVAKATITAHIVDASGKPLRGQTVTATLSGTGNSITQPLSTTDAEGVATASVSSVSAGPQTVMVTSDPGGAPVVLAAHPAITFTPAAPVVTILPQTTASGCIAVNYTLRQLQGLPVDLTFEYSPSPGAPFVRATQAGSTSAAFQGVTQVHTSSMVGSYSFLWNSSADAPRQLLTGGQLRLTATVQGVSSAPAVSKGVQVLNQLSFGPEVTAQTGGSPDSITVADMNGDGLLDAVLASGKQLLVLRSNGAGGFGAAQITNLVSTIGSVNVGDFDRDGKLDVACTLNDSGTGTWQVAFLKGAGDGTFASPVTQGLPTAPRSAVSGDFNRDGKLDLVLNGSDEILYLAGVGDGTFSGNSFPFPFSPDALAAGDFNRDGKLDVIAVGAGSYDAVVALGDGAGGFGPGISSPMSYPGRLVQTGDFNGDGIPDLAIQTNGDLRIALGNGDATFRAPSVTATDAESRGMALADFDQDGRLDVVVGRSSTRSALILLGNGDGTVRRSLTLAVSGQMNGPTTAIATAALTGGAPDLLISTYGTLSFRPNLLPLRCDPTFAGPMATPSASNNAIGAAAGDFNQDGKPDIAVAQSLSGSVGIAFGLGNGAFRPLTAYTAGAGCQAVRVADLNADGRLDLVTADFSSHTASVLLGSINGTFLSATSYPVARYPVALAVGDVNRDGVPDVLALGGAAPGVASVLAGSGDGTLDPRQGIDAGTGAVALAAGDLNGDGWLDAMVAANGVLNVLAGTDGGVLGPLSPVLQTDDPNGIALADLTGDGVLDVAVTHRVDGGVDLLEGLGDGTFTPMGRYDTLPPWTPGKQGSSFPTLADLNADGLPDVIVANTNSIAVRLNEGQGVLGPLLPARAGMLSHEPTVADFNGDGLPDLAIADQDVGVASLIGQGNGTFRQANVNALPLTPVTSLVRDFNRDGRPDVVAVSSDSLMVMLGQPGGTLGPAVAYTPADGLGTGTAAGTQDLVAADFDGDGLLDLAAANYGSNTVAIILGHGDGTFGAPVQIAVVNPKRLAAADADGDGNVDLVVACLDSVVVLRGNGAGGFTAATPVTTRVSPGTLLVADLNSDGKLDAVTADESTGKYVVLLGNGTTTTFFTAQTPDTTTLVSALAVADFTGDGKLDLVGTHTNSGNNTKVLTGRGDGTFVPGAAFEGGPQGGGIAIGDVNGDGHLDAVIRATVYGALEVLLGDGHGAFALAQAYALAGKPQSVHLADFDGDGILDLAAAADDKTFTVFKGR